MNLREKKGNRGMNILWDFDGTLFDTYPAFTDIFYDILGGDISKEEIYSRLKVSMTHAARHFGLTERQIRDWRNRETIHPGETPPFAGVEEVLQFADLNVIMAHKPRKEVLEILEYYRWERYFVHIVAGDDGFPRKPDPASYRFLHDEYGLDLAICDVKSAVRWVRDHHAELGVHPNKIAVCGASAGGYITVSSHMFPEIIHSADKNEVGNDIIFLTYEGMEHGFFNYGRHENIYFEKTKREIEGYLREINFL